MSNDALLHKSQDQIDKIKKLIGDLWWEYQRMSSSGKETLIEINDLLEIPREEGENGTL